jgi:hypothetical protein
MKSIKDALEDNWVGDRPQSLQAQLAGETADNAGHELHRLTVRVPAAVARDLHDLARSRNVSMNEIVAIFIDAGLAQEGRASIAEVAPWFAGYLRRSGTDQRQPAELPIFK